METPETDSSHDAGGSTATTGLGLPRSVTVLLGLAAAVLAIAGLRAFSGTLGPAFLALVLVVCVTPVQSWLRERGAPAWLGAIAVLLIIYAILLALIAGLAYAVTKLTALLPTYSDQFADLLDQGTGLLRRLGVGQDQIETGISQLSLSNLIGPIQQVLNSVSTIVSDFLFAVTLIFFLCTDAAGFTRRLTGVDSSRPHLARALRSFARSTRRYFVISTAFGVVVALINVGELYWLDVPLPVLWGLLAFITNYIPNIGFVLGVVPPALLALLEHGPGSMLAVIVAYSVVNLVIQSFIQPYIVGDDVGLTATLTFLSLVFWTFAIGPLGALLAVPLSVLTKALLVDSDPHLQWLRPLLGDDSGTSRRPNPREPDEADPGTSAAASSA